MMLMQRSSRSSFVRIGKQVAAAQLGFPETGIEIREICRNPIQPFAVPSSNREDAGRSHHSLQIVSVTDPLASCNANLWWFTP